MRTKVLRAWTGLCDLSPDYSPILGKTEIDNFHVSTGWGTYGFKAAPIVGTTLAELIANRRTPALIAPFALAAGVEEDVVDFRGVESRHRSAVQPEGTGGDDEVGALQ